MEDSVRKFWQARTEVVARKPEKKKNEIHTNRQELTVGLGKGKGRKSTISDKNILEFEIEVVSVL